MAMGLHGTRRGSRGRGGRRAPMADINVTPLVDVMLVLLIIFMVTAPLLTAAVPVDLPDSRARAAEVPDAEPVQLSIDADGIVYLGEERIAADALPARLAELARPGADGKPPQINLRADKALDYGRVMRVMGELNRAGLNRVALVTTGSDSAP